MADKIDRKALHDIGYGLYIVSSVCDGKLNGQNGEKGKIAEKRPDLRQGCFQKLTAKIRMKAEGGRMSRGGS